MKKYLYSVLVMALFAIGFAASGDSESSGSKGSYAGTYAIEGGYKLVINADETARFYTPNGQTYAASAKEMPFVDYITIDFGTSNWPEVPGKTLYVPVIGKDKDYFYWEVSALNAKDETKRLRITSFEPLNNE